MASHLQHLFSNMSLELFRLPAQVAAASPLFLLPSELRLLIYEFVFAYPTSSAIPLLASQQLRPLLTCRQFYQEAEQLAFARTVHYLNCAGNTNIQRRLLVLDPGQVSTIQHIRVSTTAGRFYERMQPLRFHIDHIRQPPLTLNTLTIALDVPSLEEHQREADIMKRVRDQDMLLHALWYYKNTNKVIVENLTFRKRMRSRVTGTWTCLDEDDGAYIADELLWRLEISEFEDYSLVPWQDHALLTNGSSGLYTAPSQNNLGQNV
ncbi:hypothetical protein BDV96DRAFT_655585 [Lophiotrema nucula]|uniref:F-box domain-containing protein n=1 Tax=Lophiotrema nucula TaxID=690887 RepID=A0A6A5YH74_9PLEO|nr:hypothetical protein BDV96DRAFT_655585 [Lophiotrema nucula]